MSTALSAMSMDFGVQTAKLEVSCWTGKSDEAGVARLIVREDKIGKWKGWGFE